jgi:hypothetical protein
MGAAHTVHTAAPRVLSGPPPDARSSGGGRRYSIGAACSPVQSWLSDASWSMRRRSNLPPPRRLRSAFCATALQTSTGRRRWATTRKKGCCRSCWRHASSGGQQSGQRVEAVAVSKSQAFRSIARRGSGSALVAWTSQQAARLSQGERSSGTSQVGDGGAAGVAGGGGGACARPMAATVAPGVHCAAYCCCCCARRLRQGLRKAIVERSGGR